jgi:hypothetical protein
MRRDYVTLNVRHVGRDDETLPTVVLTVDEQTETLEQRLVTADGDGIEADRLDVVFRLKGPVEDDATGVFSLSDRITGEFVLEVNADAADVLDLVDGARTDDADGRYRVVVRHDGEDVTTYEKRMLLVYDGEGGLLRGHSLIPSGVEL